MSKMNIWIDITNAPHINFFAPIIEELKSKHTIVITARDHSNTIDMLKMANVPFVTIGSHYGGKMHNKIYGFFHRVLALRNYLKDKRIDVAISHSSFYSPFVARLIGCPSIYLNDNEHALGNIPAFLFANKIMVPETLDLNKLKSQGALRKKIIQYPGVKEGIYLYSTCPPGLNIADQLSPPKIYIRPEPWNAQYYKGDQAFLDPLIKSLADHFQVTILPRGHSQGNHYLALRSDRVSVVEGAIALPDIYKDCALFIGAGGTMTREMAILGVPTISVYQDELLDVDRYLIKNGFMSHIRNPTINDIKNLLRERAPLNGALLAEKGSRARQLILDTLIGLGQLNKNSAKR